MDNDMTNNQNCVSQESTNEHIIDNTSTKVHNTEKNNNKRSSTDECVELKNIKYKTMLMNGVAITETNKQHDDLNNLEKFLESEMTQNKSEPWCKLDKTMKTRRIMTFIETYTNKNNLSSEDTSKLTKFLKDCLSKRKLSRVKDVVYDKETGVIKDIPFLIFNRTTKKFSLKNMEKRVTTLKSVSSTKTSVSSSSKKKGSIRSVDSVESLDD